MSQENLELVRAGLEIYDGKTIDPLVEVADDEIEVRVEPDMLNAGVYRGKEQFRTFLESWNEAWGEFQIEASEVFENGEDGVVALVTQRGKGAGSGAEFVSHVGFYFEIKDGRLVKWHLYNNQEDALAARGLPPR